MKNQEAEIKAIAEIPIKNLFFKLKEYIAARACRTYYSTLQNKTT